MFGECNFPVRNNTFSTWSLCEEVKSFAVINVLSCKKRLRDTLQSAENNNVLYIPLFLLMILQTLSL